MLPASRPRMPARAEAELGEASDDAADASEPGLDEGPGVDSEDVYDLSRPCDEASVDSDPVNCGRCGHDCLGGTCAAGQCQPVVLMERQPFAPGFSGRWLATDGASLYWWILEVTEPPMDAGTAPSRGMLLMMDVRQRTLSRFASLSNHGQGVVVANQQPYWINFSGGVFTFDPTSAHEANVVSGARCERFAVGPTGACVGRRNTPDTSALTCQRFGERSIEIVKHTAPHFEMDADNVYWLHGTDQMLMRTSLDGGIATPMASTGTADRFVTDAHHAYWNDGGNLHKVNLQGGHANAAGCCAQRLGGHRRDRYLHGHPRWSDPESPRGGWRARYVGKGAIVGWSGGGRDASPLGELHPQPVANRRRDDARQVALQPGVALATP
jgi:hypothetical protein